MATSMELLLLISAISFSAQAAKILDISFISTKSHKITYEPLIQELAKRGHKITRVSPYIPKPSHPNIRDILTIDVDQIDVMSNVFEMKERGQEPAFAMAKKFVDICQRTYDLPHIKEFIARKETFDVILLEAIFNECVAGLVHQLNTSVVLISCVQLPTFYLSVLGTPSPPSFIPSFTSYSDSMNFYERVVNFLSEGVLRLVSGLYFQRSLQQVYLDKLDPSLPSVNEIFKNASLVLQNSHISLNKPRPLLTDVIDVGGMHCRPAIPLPTDLADFLDNSGSDGFIYFSMGSWLNGSLMPEKYRKIFLNTFSKLKQKVLWKWETETMEDLPKNVKLSKWLPQQDVLGHPKIRAFIMHGGYGGITEAVYHGVPLIGIALFGDQPLNMGKAEQDGYAIALDFMTLTEDKLADAIHRVLDETKYRDKVQHLSRVLKDQPHRAVDLAVFWVEYVIRHKGATHLRSAARNLNFIQYHSLDVIALLVAIQVVVFFAIIHALQLLYKKCCGKDVCNHSHGSSKKDQ